MNRIEWLRFEINLVNEKISEVESNLSLNLIDKVEGEIILAKLFDVAVYLESDLQREKIKHDSNKNSP